MGMPLIDASIISICTGLQSLHLQGCYQLTDASINSKTTPCTGLQTFNLSSCDQTTDANIKSISENCTGLQSVYLAGLK